MSQEQTPEKPWPPAHITHNQARPSRAFLHAVYGVEPAPLAVASGGRSSGNAINAPSPKGGRP